MQRTGPAGAPTLILIPTIQEARMIEKERRAQPGLGLFATCGFGLAAAAASTATLLARIGPRRVLLLGIAGTFEPGAFPVGSALSFERVVQDGIGAGQGRESLGARDIGFPQWTSPAGDEVFDELPLATVSASRPPASPGPTLLSVASCSTSPAQAAERRERFAATAEDMEAFGVALACRMHGVPLGVVRGISNEVGNRDNRNWSVAPAMRAAWALAREALVTEWSQQP